MKQYLKKYISIGLAVVCLFYGYNFNCTSFAAVNEDANGGIELLAIQTYKVNFVRKSSTKARATVSAQATTTTTQMKSTIILQKYNSSTQSYEKKGSDVKTVSGNYISHEHNFTVTSSGTWRIKVKLYDGTTTHIKYKTLS